MTFADPLNWLPNGVPGVLDEAKFDANGMQTVQFASSPINNALSVENDDVVFQLTGRTYSMADLVVGDRMIDVGVLVVEGGTLSTTTGLARIGKLSPSTGHLTLSNGASLVNQRDLIIGDGGSGFFVLNAGCTASSLITFIADEPGSNGDAIIRGNWTIQNSALLGNGGTGILRVEAGGTVSVGLNTKIGDDVGSSGTLEVSGANSTFASGAVTTVGNFGRGVLMVSNGGLLTTPGLHIADDALGDVTVDGGSVVDTVGVFVGNRALGTLTLANGGAVQSPLVTVTPLGTMSGSGSVTGNVLNQGAVAPGNGAGVLAVSGSFTQTLGALNIELGGSGLGTEYDQLSATGTISLGGTLNVSLINGFNPDSGEFVIVQGGSVSGVFAVENLPAGFSISYEASRVVLTIGNACVADFNGDGIVNTQDVLLFLNAWVAGDLTADMNGDGLVNTLDFILYLNLWTAGC
ncbi:MAG: GC-type dockerin domain-anchored protein [Planctomycetota bacterium]|nr:GC-type dockerin domain-anchored protein [Planctomycetota bacterium]